MKNPRAVGSIVGWAGPGARAVLGAAVLWGTTGTAATFAPRGSSSLAVGAAAMGIGGLALFASAGRGAVGVIAANPRGRMLWVGAGAVVVYPLAFYTSMAKAGVAIGVTLSIGGAPIAAALIERVRHGRRLSRRWTATVVIAVIGSTLLGAGRPGVAGQGVADELIGIVLAVVAACCYAGYSVVASEMIDRGATSRATVGALFGLASVVLIPVLLLTGGTLIASTRGLLVVGYLGLIPMSVGYVLFARGLREVTASEATALSLLEPAVAAILAALIADQHLTQIGWLGIGMVLASVLLQTAATQPGIAPPQTPFTRSVPVDAPIH
jgi:DME family drug/metabolite transporter